jgi:demethylmenaquinone methyltransferase/2-methoxy-6-polyprenyl-1,4-benzoquinol methylase/phosphoethanolamine N-methyltransferase
LEAALELAELAPGEQMLDVGCGTATLAIAARRQVGSEGEVHGIDAAPEMIARARHKAASAGLELNLRVGLIEDFPFPNDRFDVVVSSLMIHHLPGDDLKPGGRLLVVDFEPPADGLPKPLMGHLLGHRMMENGFQRLPAMKAAGFTDVQVGRTSHKRQLVMLAHVTMETGTAGQVVGPQLGHLVRVVRAEILVRDLGGLVHSLTGVRSGQICPQLQTLRGSDSLVCTTGGSKKRASDLRPLALSVLTRCCNNRI